MPTALNCLLSRCLLRAFLLVLLRHCILVEFFCTLQYATQKLAHALKRFRLYHDHTAKKTYMRLPRTLTDILCTYYSFVSCARFQHYVSLNFSWQGKRNSLASRQLGASSSDHGSPMWSHYSSSKPSDTFRTAPSDPFLLVTCFLPSFIRHPYYCDLI